MSLPESHGVTHAGVSTALRNAADDASEGLQAPWPDLARQTIASNSTDLRDQLDQAVRQSDPGTWRKPLWWRVAGALQLLAALAVVAGMVWLGALFVVAWFQIPEPPTYEVRGFSLPPLLVFGGLLVGLVLTMIVRVLASVGSNRRAKAARTRMITGIEAVAESHVIGPLAAELSVVGDLRRLLDVAGSET